jgi:uncharacterized Ntn-hydrolase superfamily protein
MKTKKTVLSALLFRFSFIVYRSPVFVFLFTIPVFGQNFYSQNPLAHTYSIVARDTITGEMGIAVQSHWFSVGSVVSWAEAGVGAIATQSLTNISFGPKGLEMLKQGMNAQEAVDNLIAEDEGRDYRQLAIVDAGGNVAAFTGKKCIPDAGHITGDNFSVQANLMVNKKVWPAMEKAYSNSQSPLAERMIEALAAAQKEGGDIRGQQSASILIVKGESPDKVWEDKLIDLRVEDHPDPVNELKRLLKVHRAYEHMNKGDLAIEKEDFELAMKEYSAAEEMFPENLEMKYWHAVTLASIGKVDEALPLFKEVFSKDENLPDSKASWRTLTPRLVPIGILTVDEDDLNKIISVK